MSEKFLLFIILILAGAVFYFWVKSQKKESSVDDLKSLIDNQFFNFSRQIDERINQHFQTQAHSESRIKNTLDEANRSYKDVELKLNSLFEASRKIYEVGKDVSSLNDLLKSPKLRGGLGEFFLEDLLAQVIPLENFEMQYSFANGEKVDAIIKLSGGKFVCIDSKFPLENFLKFQTVEPEQRLRAKSQFIKDVKKHVDAIAEKYINPLLGTFDFALMYVPAESVYYEIILNTEKEDLIAYCYKRKVIPVSPNNLFVYLQTILIGLKGFQIEKNAKFIYDLLADLNNQFSTFAGEFETLGGHIYKAKNKYDQTEKNLAKLNESFIDISQKNHLYLDEK